MDFFSKSMPFQARCFLGWFFTFSVNSKFWRFIKKSENFQNFSKILYFIFFWLFLEKRAILYLLFFYWFSAIFCYFPYSGNYPKMLKKSLILNSQKIPSRFAKNRAFYIKNGGACLILSKFWFGSHSIVLISCFIS